MPRSQIHLFYQEHCRIAAVNADKMAEMQEAAGRPDLARSSRHDAIERRIATSAMEHGTPLLEALDYAQEARRGCLDS